MPLVAVCAAFAVYVIDRSFTYKPRAFYISLALYASRKYVSWERPLVYLSQNLY